MAVAGMRIIGEGAYGVVVDGPLRVPGPPAVVVSGGGGVSWWCCCCSSTTAAQAPPPAPVRVVTKLASGQVAVQGMLTEVGAAQLCAGQLDPSARFTVRMVDQKVHGSDPSKVSCVVFQWGGHRIRSTASLPIHALATFVEDLQALTPPGAPGLLHLDLHLCLALFSSSSSACSNIPSSCFPFSWLPLSSWLPSQCQMT